METLPPGKNKGSSSVISAARFQNLKQIRRNNGMGQPSEAPAFPYLLSAKLGGIQNLTNGEETRFTPNGENVSESDSSSKPVGLFWQR